MWTSSHTLARRHTIATSHRWIPTRWTTLTSSGSSHERFGLYFTITLSPSIKPAGSSPAQDTAPAIKPPWWRVIHKKSDAAPNALQPRCVWDRLRAHTRPSSCLVKAAAFKACRKTRALFPFLLWKRTSMLFNQICDYFVAAKLKLSQWHRWNTWNLRALTKRCPP